MADAMTILICTVGGSPSPLLSAIRASKPERVLFICSDGSGRSESSESQVPGIVAAAGTLAEGFETLKVPPDDPDRTFLTIRDRISDLRRRYPAAHLLADYTGGTKSMSAALLHVAIAAGIDVQFMVGERSDLKQVRAGTERPARLSLDFALAERRLEMLIDAWGTFGYEEAAAGFAEIHEALQNVQAVPAGFLHRVATLRDLSAGFSAWDRFDHAAAERMLGPLAEKLPDELGCYMDSLRRLASEEGREPTVLFDLWHNAERAAARGRFDDATARLYRLLEWTAQWMLRRHCGIDTGRIDLDRIPPELRRHVTCADGSVTAGLGGAWSLVEAMLKDQPMRHFMRSKRHAFEGKINREHRNRWCQARNYSILAHGARPIDRKRWEADIFPFMKRFADALDVQAKADGESHRPSQLPQRPPASLRA